MALLTQESGRQPEEDVEVRVARERQAARDRREAAAHSRGWCQGASDLLAELERAHCFTTTRARRTVARIRARLEAEPHE